MLLKLMNGGFIGVSIDLENNCLIEKIIWGG